MKFINEDIIIVLLHVNVITLNFQCTLYIPFWIHMKSESIFCIKIKNIDGWNLCLVCLFVCCFCCFLHFFFFFFFRTVDKLGPIGLLIVFDRLVQICE